MARTVRYTKSSPFITRLVIKEIVTTIGDNAYEDFEVLKELKLCDGLRQIGNYSFKGCVALEKIEINSNLESICSSAFEGCIGATELIIPKGNLKSNREMIKLSSVGVWVSGCLCVRNSYLRSYLRKSAQTNGLSPAAPTTQTHKMSRYHPTPSGFALPLHGNIRHGPESYRRGSL